MNTFEATITLPVRKLFRTVDGEASYIEFDRIPANVLAELVTGGANIIANNAFNGARGSDPKSKMTDAQKLAVAMKRVDAWYKGSYTVLERADNQTALMREAYLSEVLGGDLSPARIKAAEAQMKARVKEVLGDVNATFDNFLEATATLMSRKKGEARSALDLKGLLFAKYEAAAADIAAKRAAEAAEVTIDLDDFEI